MILVVCAVEALPFPALAQAAKEALAGAEVGLDVQTIGAATPGALDLVVRKNLADHRLDAAPPCDDAVFLRRVTLGVAGRLPTIREVRVFLKDGSPGKREALVDRLLADDDHALLSTMRWCDVLRLKSEFPVNLWPNAVQAYHQWVLAHMRKNTAFDMVVTDLLTASGSNFRVPPVNFYRAVPEKTPEGIGAAVVLFGFGRRWEWMNPPEKDALASVFAGIAYKPTAEWKEEVVYWNPLASEGAVTLPDGTVVGDGAGGDPRPSLARWLVSHPGFSQSVANRVWAWHFGRGVVEEPDDIRPANPPSVPGLLEVLAADFERSGYDLRALHRAILLSATYQQTCIPRSPSPHAERLFACYPISPLDAEVLVDILCQITGTRENYMSEIPEPFTYLNAVERSVALADGSVSSAFLELFGRPSRDTGRHAERGAPPTDEQARYLLNSRHILDKLRKGKALQELLRQSREKEKAVENLYLHILSRPPDEQERKKAADYIAATHPPKAAAEDLAWALVNTAEFRHRH